MIAEETQNFSDKLPGVVSVCSGVCVLDGQHVKLKGHSINLVPKSSYFNRFKQKVSKYQTERKKQGKFNQNKN